MKFSLIRPSDEIYKRHAPMLTVRNDVVFNWLDTEQANVFVLGHFFVASRGDSKIESFRRKLCCVTHVFLIRMQQYCIVFPIFCHHFGHQLSQQIVDHISSNERPAEFGCGSRAEQV
jgi:hypothetical protein